MYFIAERVSEKQQKNRGPSSSNDDSLSADFAAPVTQKRDREFPCYSTLKVRSARETRPV